VPPLDPAGIAPRIVGVARLPAQRADGDDAGGQLVQVRLRDDDRARGPQQRHLPRVVRRHETRQGDGRAGGRQVERVEVVLQHDGDAVQRPARAGAGALRVQRGRLPSRPRVKRDDAVERGAVVLVRGDARQVRIHQLHRGDAAGGQRRLQLGHADLVHLERRLRRCARG
jgi:hypothetical protein